MQIDNVYTLIAEKLAARRAFALGVRATLRIMR